jgi:hypothetical protein
MIEDLSVNITIRDILGKTVYQKNEYKTIKGENILNVNVASWASGMYQLSFDVNNKVKTATFIVE